MKHVTSILLAVAVLFLTAFSARDTEISEGLLPGNRAPEIPLQHLSLDGKYTLLQFWAAYDAESRVDNLLLHNKLSEMNREDVQMISLSFDESLSVFEETVKADKLESTLQFNVPMGRNSNVFKAYRLDKGFRNLLIGPDGIIVAVDVSPEQIQQILT